MKPGDLLERVQKLFGEAIKLAPPERKIFLSQSCASDPELLSAVESLISAHEQSESYQAPSASEMSGTATAHLPPRGPLTERVINHYQVKEMLGRGGMGEVYKAIDTQLGRIVAIKTLAPGLIDKPLARQRFLREAKAASQLSHPSICIVYEVGQHEDTIFIAMQYIQGETIARLISQGRLPLEKALAYALDVADALDEAHRHDIIHRDIKPSNVIVNERDVAVVLDFGLAKQIRSETSEDQDKDTPSLEDVTTHLGLMGTIPYMSPEQVRIEPLDARSDIFSFGVMFYEMLTRQRPFDGRSDIDTLHLILYRAPPLAGEINPQVDPDLALIIKKSLMKDRNERYQSLAELKRDLVNVIHERGYVVRGVSTAKTGDRGSSKNRFPVTAATRIYATDASPPKAAEPASSAPRWSSIFSRRNALVLLITVLAIISVWWFTTGRSSRTGAPSPASLKTVEVVNWTSTPGEVYSLGAFSPDARRIAYSSTESGVKSIWVKQTASGKPVQITTDEFRNDNPIWSPDGEELAFFSLRGNHPGIWRIPYLGGAPAELKELSDGDVYLRFWSNNNKIYYELGSNLFALDVNSREDVQITKFDASKSSISQINISPDEQKVVYKSVEKNGGNRLFFMPARGGSSVRIAEDPAEIRNTVWHPDSKRVLYSAIVEGIYQMFVAYTDGGKPAQITSGDKDAFVLDASTDGTKILLGSSKEESDIWGINLAKTEEAVVASDIGSELWPDVSPDGKTIAFQSIRNLSQGDKLFGGLIMTKSAAGEGRAVELIANGFLPAWSPDGRQLAFLRLSRDDRPNLYTVNATGGKENQLTAGGLPTVEHSVLPYNRGQTSYFSWSPDSSKIAYCSAKSGQRNLWVVSADGAGETKLTDNSDPNILLACPIWSADGKRIAYTSKTNKVGADGKLTYHAWVIDPETKQPKDVLQEKSLLRLLGWSQDGKALILATPKSKPILDLVKDVSFIYVMIESGEKRTIADLQSVYFDNNHLSPDGKTIAFASHQDGKDNIWLVHLGGGAPKKLTANNDSRLYFSSLAWSPDGKAIFFGKQSRYSLLSMLTNFR